MSNMIEIQYNPESCMGLRSLHNIPREYDKQRQTLWKSPKIAISRGAIHELAKMSKNEIIEFLYEEIKIAEQKNLQRVYSAARHVRKMMHSVNRKMPIEGVVYWVLDSEKEIIKIGSTSNIRRRMDELKRQYGENLELIAELPTSHMYRTESLMHSVFASRRMHGEWFNISPSHVDLWNYVVRKGWVKKFYEQ